MIEGDRMTVVIERLSDLPPAFFASLLAESEQAGSRILRRLADEWSSGVNRFDRPGECLFGARMGRGLVALGGLNVDPMPRRIVSAGCATCTSGQRPGIVTSRPACPSSTSSTPTSSPSRTTTSAISRRPRRDAGGG
jgi:hypothetical protein